MSGAAQPASAERSRQAQLRALEAQFYEQFSMPGVKAPQDEEDDEEEEGEEEEEDDDEDNLDDLDDLEDEGENASDLDDDEDLLLSAKAKQPTIPAIPARRVPETVVFTDPSSSRPSAPMSKQARKQFMSSDIERIGKEQPDTAPVTPSGNESDDDDQRANDQKLTELLSTTLFAPGSSHSTNKKRKLTTTTNETLARVLELSHADTIQRPAAGSPWAENELKKKDLGKMPARIRQGLRRAAGERRDREIATQKELGLWNPKVQKQSHMTRGSSVARGSKATQPKQRQRGIGSGVGHYRNGVLHLSDRDVQRIRQAKR